MSILLIQPQLLNFNQTGDYLYYPKSERCNHNVDVLVLSKTTITLLLESYYTPTLKKSIALRV
jgi:hypothetical protein